MSQTEFKIVANYARPILLPKWFIGSDGSRTGSKGQKLLNLPVTQLTGGSGRSKPNEEFPNLLSPRESRTESFDTCGLIQFSQLGVEGNVRCPLAEGEEVLTKTVESHDYSHVSLGD